MGVHIYHPFRVRLRATARRGADYLPVMRSGDLVQHINGPKDGPGPKEFGQVSEVRCLPGEKVEIELCCEQGLSVEKEFGKVAAELEKLGWEVRGW